MGVSIAEPGRRWGPHKAPRVRRRSQVSCCRLASPLPKKLALISSTRFQSTLKLRACKDAASFNSGQLFKIFFPISAYYTSRRAFSGKDLCRSATNDAREEALWARQEAWWAHEASRWEMERESWAAREAKLLEYISKLQDLVVELAKRQAGSTPDLSPLAAGQAAQKRPESLTAQPSVSEAQRADAVRTKQPRRPESGLRSIVDEASQYLPEEDQAFEAPRPDDFSPLNVCPCSSCSRELRQQVAEDGVSTKF